MEDDQTRMIARLKRWINENRQALGEAGVAVIEGTYDGSGDEGHFERVEALNDSGLTTNYNVPEEIERLIEALADELAAPGYENGDGGGGEIRLIVATGIITHESWFYTIERSSEGIEEY